MFLKVLLLFCLEVTSKNEQLSNIPNRFEGDWRLFCNVCNNFVRALDKDLDDAVKRDGELGWDSKVGFRLDSKGKKKHKEAVEARRSEINIIDSLEKGLCDDMKAHAVLYDKTVKGKPAERMLREREKYSKTVKQGFSKKSRYVKRANLYCAEINHRFYDKMAEAFSRKEEHIRDSFCADNVDSRCGLLSELPQLKFKKAAKKPKEESAKWKPDPNSKENVFLHKGFLIHLWERISEALSAFCKWLWSNLSWFEKLWQEKMSVSKKEL